MTIILYAINRAISFASWNFQRHTICSLAVHVLCHSVRDRESPESSLAIPLCAMDIQHGSTDHEKTGCAWDYRWCRAAHCRAPFTSLVATGCVAVGRQRRCPHRSTANAVQHSGRPSKGVSTRSLRGSCGRCWRRCLLRRLRLSWLWLRLFGLRPIRTVLRDWLRLRIWQLWLSRLLLRLSVVRLRRRGLYWLSRSSSRGDPPSPVALKTVA